MDNMQKNVTIQRDVDITIVIATFVLIAISYYFFDNFFYGWQREDGAIIVGYAFQYIGSMIIAYAFYKGIVKKSKLKL